MSTYNEAQCPNCGGFKTTTTIPSRTRSIEITRPVKPEATRWRAGCVMLTLFPALSVVFALLFVLALSIMGVPTDFLAPSCLVELLGVGAVPALILSITLLKKWNAQLIKETRSTEERLPGRDSYCLLCGYNWHWDPSEPYPSVRFNPGLIAAGEMRLREQAELLRKQKEVEEAEAQARRKRDLEWNHWNQWNNPNK